MLAGYITASKTSLAQIIIQNDRPRLVKQEEYDNALFSGFDSILSLYKRKNKHASNVACFGVAGPVLANKVTATNIPWVIDGAQIQETYGITKVRICNDIVATGKGLFELSENKFFTINKGKKLDHAHFALLAPGTGLGQGLVIFDGEKYIPYASEGGHAGFTPGNQLEIELWEHLYSNFGFVEAEDVISLKGLTRIYEFLLFRNRAIKADWFKKAADKPAKIIEEALAGSDEIAVKTLDLFVDCLAAEASNLALKGMTLGGVYLAGVITPQIITALEQGRFIDRFTDKGKMANLLTNIPVNVIIEDNTALIGAGSIAYELSK